jgi:hypothetical protein
MNAETVKVNVILLKEVGKDMMANFKKLKYLFHEYIIFLINNNTINQYKNDFN